MDAEKASRTAPALHVPRPSHPKTKEADLKRSTCWAVALGCIALSCNRQTAELEPKPATLERVAEQPNQYLGKQVTIMGVVDDVHSARAFEVENDSGIVFDKELLVLSKSAVDLNGTPVREDDELFITGTVMKLVTTEVERELGWDLQPELEVEWSDKPVLVAELISQMTPYARWSEAKDEETPRLTMTSLWIAPDPVALIGQQVDLPPLRVRSKTPEGLWVGFSHFNQLFVVPPKAQMAGIEVGDWVSIDGTLRAMPSATDAVAKWSMDEVLSAQIVEEPFYLEASAVKEVPARETAARGEGGGETVEWASFDKHSPEKIPEQAH